MQPDATGLADCMFSSHANGMVNNIACDLALEAFDKNTKYGPCVGIPRSQRWRRAQRLNLKPPTEVMAIIEASHDELIERDIYCTQCKLLRIGTRWAE